MLLQSDIFKIAGKHEHTDCYVSTASALTVVMQTDGSSTSPGFNATYVNHLETSAENDKEKGWYNIIVAMM